MAYPCLKGGRYKWPRLTCTLLGLVGVEGADPSVEEPVGVDGMAVGVPSVGEWRM